MRCQAYVVALATSFTAIGGYAAAEQPERVKIASSFVRADGCKESTQVYTVGIPSPEHLDLTYKGVLAGIEVVETTGNNDRQSKNFQFISNNHVITYQLYAKGKGQWVDPPKIFGKPLGGGLCVGAEGAWIGIDIIAHLRQ